MGQNPERSAISKDGGNKVIPRNFFAELKRRNEVTVLRRLPWKSCRL